MNQSDNSSCIADNSDNVNMEEKQADTEEISQEKSQIKNTDPYAYLNREEFTSEKFKIEIRDLPKYYGISVSQFFIFLICVV